MKKIIFCVVTFLFSSFVSNAALAAAGWRGYAKITEILINYHNAGAAVQFENSVSLNGCLSNNEVVLNRNVAGYNDMYSTLLAAYMAGKQVNIWVSGSCENNRNVVVAVSVRN